MNLNNYLPRLNLQTVEFLKGVMTPESLVFETGSGNSTIWFGKQTKKVVSLEDDRKWYDQVRESIREENLQNVKLYFDPDYSKKQFEDVLESEDAIEYDVVLHDGPFSAELRILAMGFLHLFVKAGGYLIIDDTRVPTIREGTKKYFDSLDWERMGIPYGHDAFGSRKSAIVYRRPVL